MEQSWGWERLQVIEKLVELVGIETDGLVVANDEHGQHCRGGAVRP